MSRVQKSGIIAIVILAAGTYASSRLRIDLSQPWARLQPPPATIGRWTSEEQKYSQDVYDALPGAEIFLRSYQDPMGVSGFSVSIISSPFLNNFHNPTYCYKGAGFDEVSRETIKVTSAGGALTAEGTLIVMQQARGGQKLLLFGWYVLGKRRYVEVKDLKWRMSMERFLGTGGVPAYFVSVVTPVQGDKERTARSTERFVRDLLPYVRYKYTYAPYLDEEGNISRRPARQAPGGRDR